MSGATLEAVEHLGRVKGGITQPQLVRCDDNGVYALKFNNPFPNFGLRVLPAELMASSIARWVGVGTPEIRVVSVGEQFLRRNPDLAFRFSNGGTQQPTSGPALGSGWIDNAQSILSCQVPMVGDNAHILAAVFVADNLLLMNDDHCRDDRDYGNLLLDAQRRVWVIDWGHPFFLNGCNDWSEERLAPYLEQLMSRARPLLAIPEVRELVLSVADRAATLPANTVADAFLGIPAEWRSPRCGGVTDHECESAKAFLLKRARFLPELARHCLM